jgi:mycothiol synthase
MTTYAIRAYREEDRTEAEALGTHVIGWWHARGPEASLHMVAVEDVAGAIVGHLQVVDHSFPEPTRRPGQCHCVLEVAPQHRRQGIGGELYAHAEAFVRRRKARLLYTAYVETEDAPAATFLKKRGFEVLERFYPSNIDLPSFDPAPFRSVVERVQAQGVRLLTYAEVGDSADNRRRLYALEQSAHATQPFREVEPYVPEPFEKWEQDFTGRDQTTIFLAIAAPADAWAGVVTGLEWYFTGVHPDWRGRGIATALKVLCLVEAKKRGILTMETENHGDNLPMLAINRKLGFHFTAPEAACIKRFD